MPPRTLLVLPLLVVTACASGGSSHATSSPTEDPPSLATACGSDSGIVARPLWLTTADNVRLYAFEAGSGHVAVVLAHQGGSDLCEELPYAKTLITAGLRVLAFDFRGNGHSARPSRNALAYRRDFAATIKRLNRGPTQAFLIGASMGGAAAVQNSGGLPFAGVVSLSGTRLWPGYGINKPGPRALRAPFLYLGSRNDVRAPLKEARTILRKVGSRDKRGIFYRGSRHGWELVQTNPFSRKTRDLIVAWIDKHSSSQADAQKFVGDHPPAALPDTRCPLFAAFSRPIPPNPIARRRERR
jgi:pimeloyl-ACP methyl ester carboxylesterase